MSVLTFDFGLRLDIRMALRPAIYIVMACAFGACDALSVFFLVNRRLIKKMEFENLQLKENNKKMKDKINEIKKKEKGRKDIYSQQNPVKHCNDVASVYQHRGIFSLDFFKLDSQFSLGVNFR